MIREFLPERATAIAAMFLVLVSKVGFEYSLLMHLNYKTNSTGVPEHDGSRSKVDLIEYSHLVHLNSKTNSTGIPGHEGFRSKVYIMIAAETVRTITKQTA